MTEIAAYLYPWDVVDDPAAPDLIAGLGLDHVVLAAAYHGTRALTPRHPRHRIVVAEHTAAYYRSPGGGSGDAFGIAVGALRSAGVRVHAWAVVNHVDLPAAGAHHVINAFGDRYPWALCPARAAVADYALGLATDIAGLPGIDGVELESCGWYGFDHLSAHDKAGGPQPAVLEFLLSLCFCDACVDALRAGGLDPLELRDRVRTAIDATLSGASGSGPAQRDAGADVLVPAGDRVRIAAALPEADQVIEVRQGIADRYRAAIVSRLRDARPDLRIALHAHPQPHRYTSFTGVDASVTARAVDDLVVNCWHDLDALPDSLAGGGRVHASLLAVAGLGGRRTDLTRTALAARDAGAHGIRLYHAGLASAADLAAITSATSRIRADRNAV